MKTLKIISLGVTIWGLSLVWPEINLLLTPRVAIGFSLGLGLVALIYELLYQFGHWHHQGNGTRHDHPSRPLAPVALHR